LDDYKRYQLIQGPDALLLAGMGYLRRVGSFNMMSEQDQAEVMTEMKADWEANRDELMAWWNAGKNCEPFSPKPWIFPMYGTPDTLPWAAGLGSASTRSSQALRVAS
jgi:hypothetical protein